MDWVEPFMDDVQHRWDTAPVRARIFDGSERRTVDAALRGLLVGSWTRPLNQPAWQLQDLLRGADLLLAAPAGQTASIVGDLWRVGSHLQVFAQRHGYDLSPREHVQSMRNGAVLWLMRRLQGEGPELPDALCAYCHLYPLADNALDRVDPQRDTHAFLDALDRTIDGSNHEPALGKRGRAITHAIRTTIADDPVVARSLQALNDAQRAALSLRGALAFPRRLALALRKGGTSVLVDSMLCGKDVDSMEARAAFRLGAALQLLDDMEDEAEDRAEGRRTAVAAAADAAVLQHKTIALLTDAIGELDANAIPLTQVMQTAAVLCVLMAHRAVPAPEMTQRLPQPLPVYQQLATIAHTGRGLWPAYL